MPTAPTPMPISPDSQESVVRYLSSAIQQFTTNFNIRGQLLQRDMAYLRTNDTSTQQSTAAAANATGDPSKMQNITVPVVMPQVESALADLQETFLTGYPIFGVVAPAEQIEAMSQMETIIGENSIRAAWPLELLKTMRNGLKYDLGASEVTWQTKKLFALTTPELQNQTQGAATETYYQGNFIKDIDPYNLILDIRVSPEKNHSEGEFAGYSEHVSRIELKKRMEDLPPLGCMNFKAAFESPSPGSTTTNDATASVYYPQINPDALLPMNARKGFNWMHWGGLESGNPNAIRYQESYEWSVLYAKILPSDFKIPSKNKNHVAIYKFIIINRSVVIFAERQTNAHNFLPIIVCKPSADGLGWQSKSFAENAVPFQQVATSIILGGLESQRRKVYDRMFYDPSKINKKDIDRVDAVARIPIKNSGYGKPIADSVHVVPYRDEGIAETMQMSQVVAAMADKVNGQNNVTQGQFQKGNKTRKEFDTVMGNSGSRGRMRALAIEYSYLVPIKQIILSNILQYQPPTTLVNTNVKPTTAVKVDPEVLRKANLSFSLSDGFLPSEKLISGELFGTVFQAAQAIPAIAAEYDIMGMFLYSMQLQGGGWMQQFKRTPEQSQQYTAQMAAASQAAGTANPPPPATPGAPA